MDPRSQFCPDPHRPARGRAAQGNIKIHSHQERRSRPTTCGKTFAAPLGTSFDRLHKGPTLFVRVVIEHRSIRVPDAESGTKWRGRTPAMAANGTDHVRSLQGLLSLKRPILIHG
jgi:hypothetical protein